MGLQLREGQVQWVRDLNASTSTTAYPTLSTQGVKVPSNMQEGNAGSRVHIMCRHAVASGVMSLYVSVYGYSATGDFSAGGWSYLGSFNNASSMAADTSKWSPDASTISTVEVFSMSGANYQRIATRQIAPGGTGVSTDTYVGFPVE